VYESYWVFHVVRSNLELKGRDLCSKSLTELESIISRHKAYRYYKLDTQRMMLLSGSSDHTFPYVVRLLSSKGNEIMKTLPRHHTSPRLEHGHLSNHEMLPRHYQIGKRGPQYHQRWKTRKIPAFTRGIKSCQVGI
jgi:hypothetical protein